MEQKVPKDPSQKKLRLAKRLRTTKIFVFVVFRAGRTRERLGYLLEAEGVRLQTGLKSGKPTWDYSEQVSSNSHLVVLIGLPNRSCSVA